jgi:hypothetical protein
MDDGSVHTILLPTSPLSGINGSSQTPVLWGKIEGLHHHTKEPEKQEKNR